MSPRGLILIEISQHVTESYLPLSGGGLIRVVACVPREGNNTYGLDAGQNGDMINKKTSGWGVGKTERVMWVGREFDPWRSTTIGRQTAWRSVAVDARSTSLDRSQGDALQ
ncbi:hypothetical protein E4U57_004405 [Claviceps arundinis]|uniref:Uncharacterized protein n=1 Tax=Claviceps arundinis TaxID=1623583 RepID=A0ABQ7PIY4_9HYPO|nr:hypothetical protein E4U57_004405 [Claviceps arundinis]